MKKSWYILIFSAVGWATVLVAEYLGFSMSTIVSSSIKTILTTMLAVGLAIPFIETAIDTASNKVADTVSPSIERGFSRLLDTIQKFELTSELRDLRNYLPHHIKYIQHSRTFNLEPGGDAVITGEYIIKNISDRSLYRVILPIFGFGLENYDAKQSYDKLLELSIDGRKVDTPIDAVRTLKNTSPPVLDGVTQPHMIECCYRVPVDLKPNHTVRILLRFRNFGCAKPMYQLDHIGARIYDITEKLVLRIVAPDKHTIKLLPTTRLQRGFTVLHLATEDEHPDELSRIASPEMIGNKEICWQVESPIIGYAYIIRYQVQQLL